MKENANPTVYVIQDTRRNQETGIGTAYFQEFELNEEKEISTVKRSLYLGLLSIDDTNCSTNSDAKTKISMNEDPLYLLKQAGMFKNDPSSKSILQQPTFKPSSLSSTLLNGTSSSQLQANRNSTRDKITPYEIFEIIRNIQDPEHPLTLEQLKVVNLDHIEVQDNTALMGSLNDSKNNDIVHSYVDVRFTPTIPHCSMATLIGLCIRVKLLRSLPSRFKVTVRINPGTHASESAVNKQLADKERVIAALENKNLLGVVNRCIADGMNSS